MPASHQTQAERLAMFSDEELAYHEAGHAVVHLLDGGTVTRLSIDRADARRGTRVAPREAQPAPGGDARAALSRTIATLAGGEAALARYGSRPETAATSAENDRAAALRAADGAGLDPAAARAMIDEEWSRVRERMDDAATWAKVQALAAALLERKALDASQIAAALDDA